MHLGHFLLFNVRKNPMWERSFLGPCPQASSGARLASSTSGAPARPPEDAKAMCARLVGRSCKFGTDASLECGAVVIKTRRPALAFG